MLYKWLVSKSRVCCVSPELCQYRHKIKAPLQPGWYIEVHQIRGTQSFFLSPHVPREKGLLSNLLLGVEGRILDSCPLGDRI